MACAWRIISSNWHFHWLFEWHAHIWDHSVFLAMYMRNLNISISLRYYRTYWMDRTYWSTCGLSLIFHIKWRIFRQSFILSEPIRIIFIALRYCVRYLGYITLLCLYSLFLFYRLNSLEFSISRPSEPTRILSSILADIVICRPSY